MAARGDGGRASTVLDAYLLHTTGGVVDTPDSSLVTGYDFLDDAANTVKQDCGAASATPRARSMTS